MTNTQITLPTQVIRPKPRLWLNFISNRIVRRFAAHPLALLGAGMLVFMVLCALFAPLLAPYDPVAINISRVNHPPDAQNWLGTDMAGRDVLSRILYGARISLAAGTVAVTIYLSIGLVLGLLSGYFGGWVDSLIMRFTDLMMCFPTFALMLILAGILGPSLFNVMIIIGLFNWPGIARLVRGQVLQVRELDYILAARSIGCTEPTILARHTLPNLVGPLTVAGAMGIGSAILAEAGLSFLGLGVVPPAPSWGAMLSLAREPIVLVDHAWLWIAPGTAITITVLAVNFMGDGLRDAFDLHNWKEKQT